MSAAIRAPDAHTAGGSYRIIADVLFGKQRSPIYAIERSDGCRTASR
ncbi:hypothetical protein [Bradyrhizobium elkanii]